MALTDIADQLTPGRPTEITFGASLGTPSTLQNLMLIGHASSGATGVNTVVSINNVADIAAASGEAGAKFGDGSELAKMVIAAVTANVNAGSGNFPSIKCVPLASTDTAFGTSDAALTAAAKVRQEFVVSPYDGNSSSNTNKIIAFARSISGPQNVENNQFGTMAVYFNRSVADPSALPLYDTQFGYGVYYRDTVNANGMSVGEAAAAAAALTASAAVPFNPLNKVEIPNIAAPSLIADQISVGAGLESEAALTKGWTPLYTKPNGATAFVRTVTARRTSNGTTAVTAYYDVQDFQVLYYWRNTVVNRLNQPDLVNVKASITTAKLIKSELLRLATLFQTNGMFQNVNQLASQFIVERSSSDRGRFDIQTPVNVIPGLSVVATNIIATTQFDNLTV